MKEARVRHFAPLSRAGFGIIEFIIAIGVLVSLSLLWMQSRQELSRGTARNQALVGVELSSTRLRAILVEDPIGTQASLERSVATIGGSPRALCDLDGDGACGVELGGASTTAYFAALDAMIATGLPGFPVSQIWSASSAASGFAAADALYVANEGIGTDGIRCGSAYGTPKCPFRAQVFVRPDNAVTDFGATAFRPNWQFSVQYQVEPSFAQRYGIAVPSSGTESGRLSNRDVVIFTRASLAATQTQATQTQATQTQATQTQATQTQATQTQATQTQATQTQATQTQATQTQATQTQATQTQATQTQATQTQATQTQATQTQATQTQATQTQATQTQATQTQATQTQATQTQATQTQATQTQATQTQATQTQATQTQTQTQSGGCTYSNANCFKQPCSGPNDPVCLQICQNNPGNCEITQRGPGYELCSSATADEFQCCCKKNPAYKDCNCNMGDVTTSYVSIVPDKCTQPPDACGNTDPSCIPQKGASCPAGTYQGKYRQAFDVPGCSPPDCGITVNCCRVGSDPKPIPACATCAKPD